MNISKLHYISQELGEKNHADLIREACEAGADWVQLRLKDKSYEEAVKLAEEVKDICRKYNAAFIINDHVALAKEVKADGVHLGRRDMDPSKAREILGDGYIIGGTSNTFLDILALQKARVDYIGLGPYRFTTTKKNLSPILGLEGYQQLLKECLQGGIEIPVIAIGGIQVEDVAPLMEAGVHGVAVSGLVNTAADKNGIIRALKEKLQIKDPSAIV